MLVLMFEVVRSCSFKASKTC